MQEKQDIQQTQMKMIWLALIVSNLLYIFTANYLFLNHETSEFIFNNLNSVQKALSLLPILPIPITFAIFHFITLKTKTPQTLFTWAILNWAMNESVTILGLATVIYFQTFTFFYPSLITSVVLQLYMSPWRLPKVFDKN